MYYCRITDIETTKYLKIEEVSKLKSGDVNLYGVVMAYREDRNKLTLMDETFPTKYDIVFLKGYDPRQTLDEYSLYIGQKSKDVNGKVPIRTGDIIRIENLCLPENIAANVVVSFLFIQIFIQDVNLNFILVDISTI